LGQTAAAQSPASNVITDRVAIVQPAVVGDTEREVYLPLRVNQHARTGKVHTIHSSCRDNGTPVSRRGDRRDHTRSSAAGGAPLSELVANQKTGKRSQAFAWMAAGWLVSKVDVDADLVKFSRQNVEPGGEG
jgi:hypothetical protein